MKIASFWPVALCFLLLSGLAARSEDKLEQDFANPPADARPQTYWHWMNGNVTKEGITADLEAMARIGIGGAAIFNVAQHDETGQCNFTVVTVRQFGPGTSPAQR